MEFMLDTLNLDEIKKWSEILPLAGVTSNPTIAKREGSINFFERIKDVRELIGSTPSIHVQVISQDFEGILKDAHEIRRQAGDDIFIKVPVTPAGLRAIKVLKKEGYHITATAIYTVIQGLLAYVDEIAKYPNTRYGRGPIGGIRYSGTSSISANVGQGRGTLATPDGRNAGTPLAEGCSPSHNMDQHGPTSVLKSVSKLPTDEIVGGVLLNQKVNPQTLAKEEDKLKLIALLRTFFNRLHGYHIQYNVVSRETLIDAQKHPEKHRDLIVRVAGYSAFFNVLSKATQDDIIGRTEHTL
ncbi:formate acetyltransferase [Streptococcus pneumoniae]|nr:formate acetyltransferase [Streptococcus pneumoniae]